jgi:general stress protein 26
MAKVNKNSKCSQRQNWMVVSKYWCKLKVDTNKHDDLHLMFANHEEEEKIYTLTRIDIAKAQKISRTKDLL